MRTFYTILLTLFTVLSLQAQNIFEENFDSGLPSDWTVETNATDGGWLNGTNVELSSQSFPIPDMGSDKVMATNEDNCNCDKSKDLLITPSIDLSGVSAAFLSCDVFFGKQTYEGADEQLFVEYSLDGGESWTVIKEVEASVVDNDINWANFKFPLNDVVGQSDVLLGFLYTDGNGWLYGAAIDNVIIYEPDVILDAAITDITTTQILLAPSTTDITGVITNTGFEAINSLDITWSDGTNSYTQNFDNLNIGSTETYNFTHPDKLNVTLGSMDIVVSISNVNGMQDEDPSNDEMSISVSGVESVPTKVVIGEEATGTWCGWCPRGAVKLEEMAENYPDTWIGIAVHNGDPMAVAEYDGSMGVGGYPSGHVDRLFKDVDPGDFETYYNERKDVIPPAGLSITATYDENTRKATMEVRGDFIKQLEGDYRYNLVMVENGVTGTGSGYAQSNYYSGGGAGPMGGYEDLPETVPAEDMVYDHVARAILGGWAGEQGSLPATIIPGENYTYEFTYTIPESYNAFNMEAVAMLISPDGEILNGAKVDIPATPLLKADFDFTVAGMSVDFTNMSTSNAATFTWSFDDGNISTEENPVHTYATAGSYNVCLIVSDGETGEDQACKTVEIAEPPVAAFTYEVVSGMTYKFTDASTGAASWNWDFGDGGTSALQNPVHSFSNGSSFEVCLTVANQGGSTDKSCQTVSTMVGIIEGTAFNALNVYPNPSNGLVRADIELKEVQDLQVQISNALGQVIITNDYKNVNNSSLQFDLSNAASGIYFLEAKTENGMARQQIVLTK